MKLGRVFTAAGVAIRRPPTESAGSGDQTRYLCLLPERAQTSSGDVQSDADEALAVFQELAFQYAMEQTRAAVRAILLSVNKKCYSDAHRFFQRYMYRIPNAGSKERCARQPNSVVFPTLAKLPAVAVVSGSDATFNDVWTTPLFQVIHRSFPGIFLVRDNIGDGRQLVEWVLDRLDDYAALKKREEAWLGEQIQLFFNTTEDGKLRQARVLELQRRRLRERPGGRNPGSQRRGAKRAKREPDCEDHQLEAGSDSESARAGSERARSSGGNQKKGGKSNGGRPLKYADYLVDDLMADLHDKMRIFETTADPTATYNETLREVVLEHMNASLVQCEGRLEESVAKYVECIEWVKSCISAYRQTIDGVSLVHSATAEFSLAVLGLRLMSDFRVFLKSSKPESSREADFVRQHLQQLEISIIRHEDSYHLHHFSSTHVDANLQPFMLLCIEHLDKFNQRTLQEFIDLWGHYTKLHPERTMVMRFGFIFGVTSTTSQALRLLGHSITRALDIQFYPLEDSKTRSDDILEALFVNDNFPLCIRGDALRLLDNRHLTSQSLTMLMQALEFIALSHFQEVPGSFLSHFALESHHTKPMHTIANVSPSIRRWLHHAHFRGRCINDYFKHLREDTVRMLVGGGGVDTKRRIGQLETELSHFREARAKWVIGWKCFRAACEWFNVADRGESFVESLALALDGDLAHAHLSDWIAMMIEGRQIDLILHLLKDWASIASNVNDQSLHNNIEELILLSEHVSETYFDPETERMRPIFRAEIVRFFRQRILGMTVLEAPKAGDMSAMVHEWSIAAKDPTRTTPHLVLKLHEDVVDTLQLLDDDAYANSTAACDLSLAFLHYREHPALQINVAEWFVSFADAAREEAGHEVDSDELNARFARALATLRLWGYIKGPDRLRRGARGFDELKVEKRIFI